MLVNVMTIVVVSGASMLNAGSLMAAKRAMNDLEIAHSAHLAGKIDIRFAHLAMAISEDSHVREFAETMIRDHSAVNTTAVALIKKLNVTPQDNDLSHALNHAAAKKSNELRRLNGKAFDCAYAKNELEYHRLVEDMLKSNFIPNAKVPELKDLLFDALTTFKVHVGHATHMISALRCGA